MTEEHLEAKKKAEEYLLKVRGDLGVPPDLADGLRAAAEKGGFSPLIFAAAFTTAAREHFKDLDNKAFSLLSWMTLLTVFGDDYVLRPREPRPPETDSCPICSQAGQTPVFDLQPGGVVLARYTCYHPHCGKEWTDRFTFEGRTFDGKME